MGTHSLQLPEGLGLSYDDLCALFADVDLIGTRCELFDGVLAMTPSPNLFHQSASMALALTLGSFVREQKLGILLTAPIDVIFDPLNVCVPDIVFVSNARRGLLSRRGLEGAPDLVVEILSPSTEKRDRGIKREVYARHGASEYWLVSVTAQQIEQFRAADGRLELQRTWRLDEQLETPLLAGLAIDLTDVFRSPIE